MATSDFDDLTERDLELIEVALDSAISAVSFSFHPKEKDMDPLAKEYRTAQRKIEKIRAMRGR